MEFLHQGMWNDCNECKSKVNEEQTHLGDLTLQVKAMWTIISGAVLPGSTLVRIHGDIDGVLNAGHD